MRLLIFFIALVLASAAFSAGATPGFGNPPSGRTAAENVGGQGRQPCGFFSTLAAVDALNTLKPGEMENWLLRVGGLMSLVLLALYTRKAWLDNFGRKPGLDDSIEMLRKQLDGLVPSEKVDKLIEQIGGAASREELAKVVALLMEKERDLGAQIKDVRSYAHDSVHGLRNEMQTILSAGEGREIRLGGKIDGVARDFLQMNNLSTERLHERIEAMSNTLRAESDAKLRIVHEDITELPGRVLTLLQQTGQIGGGRGGKS